MNNGKPPANPFSLGLGIKTLSNLLCTRSTAQHMMMQETDDVSGELVMRCAAVAVAPKVIIYMSRNMFYNPLKQTTAAEAEFFNIQEAITF